MTEIKVMNPTVFHLTQAIKAMQAELKHVPPFSVDKETRTAEICQLIDMLDRRRRRKPGMSIGLVE